MDSEGHFLAELEGREAQHSHNLMRANLQRLQKTFGKAEHALRKAKDALYALYDPERFDPDEEDSINKDEDGSVFHALIQEILGCLRQALAAQQAYVHYLEACVRSQTRGPLTALYSAMNAKLPVEIRGMVYSYLDVKKQETITFGLGPYFPNFEDEEYHLERLLREGHEAIKAGTYDAPILQPGGWLINAEFVGSGLAREIADIFYTSNRFSLSAYQLRDFLTVDRTQSGMKPYEFVSGQLEVDITTNFCESSSEGIWPISEDEITFLDGLYTQLKTLTLIPPYDNSSMLITLHASPSIRGSDLEGYRRLHNVLEAVRTPIYDLMHAGWNIQMWHSKALSRLQQSIQLLPYDLLALEQAEWKQEKRSDRSRWLPSTSGNLVLREEYEEARLHALFKLRWAYASSPEDFEKVQLRVLA
ncbi:hypothetical protein K491DRAFT_690371 [Lophiostoma macrostomum CBS 122681]|uniref:Uncharacterized protein n=1 Tax=Lophiostoma macrostomum CBS 122681 TaxID=1314788 RepID=A0A6A6TFK9_9PLEO|nr:hypothetical protein K491DRAFT_690371 [Lophiostoma macrostomum CBS 122681]